MTADDPTSIRRLLVVLPNWVGDVVMATPVLAALRTHLAGASITFLMRPYVREITAGGDWNDEALYWPASRGVRSLSDLRGLIRAVRARAFDAALLLTNSFRSALATWLARVPRRVGYARDGRTLLLTDRLVPQRRAGTFEPTPLLPYYVALAERIGCDVPDRRLRLPVSAEQEAAGAALLERYGLARAASADPVANPDAPTSERRRIASRYAVINPGAAFGAAKCWLPERFAAVCDRLAGDHDVPCVLVGAPSELPLLRRIAELAASRPIVLDDPPTTLGTLKVLIREAALLVCNDTGPRHYGNAFGVPTVTIFGPTHQEWTRTDYAGETRLQARVECGPCQLPRCPLDHRCMTKISVDDVVAAANHRLTAAG